MNSSTIYVIGHKNPDTDSICSAIAYARLCSRQGQENVQPARAGNVNRQTEFVLEELGIPLPPLLVDVYPRVRDVVGTQVVTIDREAPLARALELFHQHSVRLLPVIDRNLEPMGLLVLKRVAERFLIPGREQDLRKVLASPASIRDCLRATALHRVAEESVEELDLYVGAMASATFHRKMEGLDPRRIVLITGDRENIQRKAVELGVRVLIVTADLPVRTRSGLARQNGVTILSTPFDTANSAWLTRLATPVHCLLKEGFETVGLQDRLDDLRFKLLHSRDPGVIVLDGAGKVAVATRAICSFLLRSS
jgi:manganese-dependent inorganic pyrophosphatase